MLHQHHVVNRGFCYKASTESPLGHLLLNYPELKCLEIALHFLTKQLNHVVPLPSFVNLRQHHVDYLQKRLNRHLFRCKMNIINQQEQRWELASLEDIEWLDLALRFGVTWETVRSLAEELASYESDMQSLDDGLLDDPHHVSVVYDKYFSKYFESYSQFMPYSVSLLTKLKVALKGQK